MGSYQCFTRGDYPTNVSCCNNTNPELTVALLPIPGKKQQQKKTSLESLKLKHDWSTQNYGLFALQTLAAGQVQLRPTHSCIQTSKPCG